MQAHILNLYEANDLLLADVYAIIDRALYGGLDGLTEKLDGQNFSFTVIDGQVRFLGKGLPKWAVEQGGLDGTALRKKLMNTHPDKPQIAETFVTCYNRVQEAIDEVERTRHSGLAKKVFQEGKVAIISELVTPDNVNVIKYHEDMVCLLHMQPAVEGVDLITEAHFDVFCQALATRAYGKIKSPRSLYSYVSVKADREQLKHEFVKRFDALLRCTQCHADDTVGDLKVQLMMDRLDNWSVEADVPVGALLKPMAQRLSLGDKTFLTKKMCPDSVWKWFQSVEKEGILNALAFSPFEHFCQDLGCAVFDLIEHPLACCGEDHIEAIIARVQVIKDALYDGRVIADHLKMQRIAGTVIRMGDETRFKKNIEGVIFDWHGQRLKLSGMFPMINRLFGYFDYGKDPARIEEK